MSRMINDVDTISLSAAKYTFAFFNTPEIKIVEIGTAIIAINDNVIERYNIIARYPNNIVKLVIIWVKVSAKETEIVSTSLIILDITSPFGVLSK